MFHWKEKNKVWHNIGFKLQKYAEKHTYLNKGLILLIGQWGIYKWLKGIHLRAGWFCTLMKAGLTLI